MGLLSLLSKNKAKVSITNINIKALGGVHTLDGRAVRDSVFTLKLPFTNKSGSDLVPEHLKRPSIKLREISVSPPFMLESVEPTVPIDIGYKQTVEFTFKIKAPEFSYSGPMTIDFGSAKEDSIHLNIDKIVLLAKGRRVPIEESSIITTLPKSQILKKDIQLYKAMSFGDKLNKIRANEPFEILETSPKLPVTLDKKNSYMLTIYFKVPDFGYAGSLELTLE